MWQVTYLWTAPVRYTCKISNNCALFGGWMEASFICAGNNFKRYSAGGLYFIVWSICDMKQEDDVVAVANSIRYSREAPLVCPLQQWSWDVWVQWLSCLTLHRLVDQVYGPPRCSVWCSKMSFLRDRAAGVVTSTCNGCVQKINLLCSRKGTNNPLWRFQEQGEKYNEALHVIEWICKMCEVEWWAQKRSVMCVKCKPYRAVYFIILVMEWPWELEDSAA